MFTATKIESTNKPEKFKSLNNGIWYYNYDIAKRTVKVRDLNSEEDKEESRYRFVQVRISGKPTLTKCYEAILKVYKDMDGTSLYEAVRIDSSAKEVADEIYYNIKIDFGLEEEISPLEKAKKLVLKEIDEYDKSIDVNSFFLNGIQAWLDKDTRVGLMNSLTIEKNAGKEVSALWFNNICINISCDAAIQILSSLELYALDCYNRTAEHKVNINKLNNIEDIINYDFTTGYPTKLNFNI